MHGRFLPTDELVTFLLNPSFLARSQLLASLPLPLLFLFFVFCFFLAVLFCRIVVRIWILSFARSSGGCLHAVAVAVTAVPVGIVAYQ